MFGRVYKNILFGFNFSYHLWPIIVNYVYFYCFIYNISHVCDVSKTTTVLLHFKCTRENRCTYL